MKRFLARLAAVAAHLGAISQALDLQAHGGVRGEGAVGRLMFIAALLWLAVSATRTWLPPQEPRP